jgi:hypothetical protein
VFAAVALIAAYLWRAHWAVVFGSLGFAIALAGISLAAPMLLRPFNSIWFRFGLLLSKIVKPLVMSVIFAIVIVPCGIIMQLRSDPLRKRRQPDAESYWIECGQRTRTSNMAHQF